MDAGLLLFWGALHILPAVLFGVLANLPAGDVARWAFSIAAGAVAIGAAGVWTGRLAGLGLLFVILPGGAVATALAARGIRQRLPAGTAPFAWPATMAAVYLAWAAGLALLARFI